MESRTVKAQLTKNSKGNPSPKAPLSWIWLKKMGITADDRDLLLTFDGESITIRKAPQKKE